jgi:hypothetical protein
MIAARSLAMALLALSLLTTSFARAADELERRASWSFPAPAEVKAQLDDWLTAQKADEVARLKVSALWPDEAAAIDGSELLSRLTASLAVLDSDARQIVKTCDEPLSSLPPPKFEILTKDDTPPLVKNNLRLLYARYLVQNNLIDEALDLVRDLKPSDVVDPASLLFYQAVGYHRLLEKEPCLAAADKLLENEAGLPRRYATLAKLMQADMQPLKVDSLDEIARLMDDIRRRLDLARAGKKVRDEEESVIAKLEKMIEEMEKQQQQQQQQASSGNSSPSKPMEDSTPGQLKGPGEVDPKDIGKKEGWGNLPPKDRQEVLQQIGRELPAHFRETIEEYFKRLAQDGVK